ncbi:MAG: response regulator transcription factor [Armatimonadetes bacterium]|nr:response regulator transcription factor [Armatimonadota bacterium]
MKVLVVDDEVDLAEAVREVLSAEGFTVRLAHNAESGLALLRTWQPDAVLLDIMMPGSMTGLDALRALRPESDVPVILMSARGQEHDKVLGLEYADDYLVKPFSNAEMVARLRAVLRRAGARAADPSAGVSRAGELAINLETGEAVFGNRPLPLTPTEYRILSILAARPGRLYPRDELMARVWGEDAYVDPHALDVHIRGLRSKLEPNPSRPAHVVTVRGMGVRYVP